MWSLGIIRVPSYIILVIIFLSDAQWVLSSSNNTIYWSLDMCSMYLIHQSIPVKLCLSYTMHLPPDWKSWKQGGRREQGKQREREKRAWMRIWLTQSIRVAELQFLPCRHEAWPILHKASHFKHKLGAHTVESCHVQLPRYCHLPAAWLPALL